MGADDKDRAECDAYITCTREERKGKIEVQKISLSDLEIASKR